jgi:phosphoadenosine phosphosulfate reductase
LKTALQFGGGKDSLACLYLLEPRWSEITVMWMNTGAAFPETLELMERIAKRVPHFVEVKADVMHDVAVNGWPVDLLPTLSTALGQHAEAQPIRLRSWADCCAHNIWFPLHSRTQELGITEVIRGQRNEEVYKSRLRDGAVIDGITYRYPLQDWTTVQVYKFLNDRGVEIPAYYQHTPTSLDCWLCTAYMDTKAVQLGYLKDKHPQKYELVRSKLLQIKAAIDRTYQPLATALNL